MGENKAFIDFHGQTLLARALQTLRQVSGEVTIVGEPRLFASFGPVIADIFPGRGPLGGIHSALAHSQSELNLMLAIDMPFVNLDLLKFLFNKAAETAALVTVPRTRRGLQPLCAVYRPAFAAVAEQALQAGSYKIDATFAGIAVQVIDEQQLAVAGYSEKNFFNLNTPEDRHAADLIP